MLKKQNSKSRVHLKTELALLSAFCVITVASGNKRLVGGGVGPCGQVLTGQTNGRYKNVLAKQEKALFQARTPSFRQKGWGLGGLSCSDLPKSHQEMSD